MWYLQSHNEPWFNLVHFWDHLTNRLWMWYLLSLNAPWFIHHSWKGVWIFTLPTAGVWLISTIFYLPQQLKDFLFESRTQSSIWHTLHPPSLPRSGLKSLPGCTPVHQDATLSHHGARLSHRGARFSHLGVKLGHRCNLSHCSALWSH